MIKIIITFLIILSPSLITAQWEQTNGPYGGTPRCFAVDGSNVFMGTNYNGGFYSSTNGGVSWSRLNNSLSEYDFFSLIFKESSLFAGTRFGIYKSTNNGINWNLSGLSTQFIWSLAVSGNNIFAGTSGSGIYLSTNNGSNWNAVNNGLSNLDVRTISISGTNIYAGTFGGGVFKSTNNGNNWSSINNGITNLTILTSAISGSNVFVGTQGNLGGVFKSTNNGINWSIANTGLLNTNIYALTVSQGNLFAGTQGGGLYKSTNSGINWFYSNSGLTSAYVWSFATSGNNLIAGCFDAGGCFYSTNNGGNWLSANNGLLNQNVTSLEVFNTTLFAGTNRDGIFKSTNNGVSWEKSSNGLPNTFIYSVKNFGSTIFAGTSGLGGIFKSIDNGLNWIVSNAGLTNQTVLILQTIGSNIFAGTYGGGLFLSTNNGTEWISTNNGITNNNIWDLTSLGTSIFCATENGIFRSTNDGTTWIAVNNGLTNTNVRSITSSGTNIIAGTYGSGIYLSSNNGNNWSLVHAGIPYVWSFSSSGSNVYAGTPSGVFLSTNNGFVWSNYNQSFPPKVINSLLVANNFVFAGTQGSSVWRRFNSILAPTNLAYDTINNRLVWTLSLSSNVNNYLVYKKGSDNLWKSVADSGGMLSSNVNFYNIQTSGFNYYKVAAISNSGDTAKSDSIYVNRGYVLKKWNAGIIEPYKIRKHSFSFGNTTSNMWPSSVYSHYNNYSDPPYPRELFMRKRGPFWVTKIHSRAFSDWKLFTDIFGNENSYLHHGSNPPQTGDVFNKKAVDIWYSSLRNNRFYDGLISDFPGVCVGFSIASALSFTQNTSFYNQFPVMSNVDSVFGLTLSGGNGNDIRKVINHLGAINHVIRMPSILQSTSPRVVLSQIVDSLSVIRSLNNHYNIALGLADDKAFVHAVFPYAVERDPLDNNIFYIYIYDSNRPGNERKRILVNTNTDKCSYENYNQNMVALYAEIDKYLGIQKLPGIDRLEFNNSKTESIFTTLFTSIKNSVFIIDPLTTDTIAGYRNSDSTLFGNPDRILIPMTDGRFNIPQSYSIPLQNTNIFMKDFVNDSSGIFFSYFADTNTFIRYERYDSISSDQTDIIRIVNGSLSMYNPDALIKKINLTSIISSNSTINNQKTFEVNNFGFNYHDSVSSIIIDSSEMKLKNYGQQSSYNLSLIYSDSSTSKYFNHLNIIIPENSSHIVSPVWDSITTQSIQIYVDIGNNGTIDDTIRVNNIITNSEEGFVSLPDKYSLAQNYPNPFNPSTIIKYNLKNDGLVTLKVYNVLGKEVASLVNEVKRAGRYEVEFNGSNLSSGIYYYRLKSLEYSETKKMLLLK